MSPVDRKSTRLNSSHGYTSYAVFCLKKTIKKPPTFAGMKTYNLYGVNPHCYFLGRLQTTTPSPYTTLFRSHFHRDPGTGKPRGSTFGEYQAKIMVDKANKRRNT